MIFDEKTFAVKCALNGRLIICTSALKRNCKNVSKSGHVHTSLIIYPNLIATLTGLVKSLAAILNHLTSVRPGQQSIYC